MRFHKISHQPLEKLKIIAQDQVHKKRHRSVPGKFISISLSCAKSLLNTLFAAGTQKICRVSAGYRLELVLPGVLFGTIPTFPLTEQAHPKEDSVSFLS